MKTQNLVFEEIRELILFKDLDRAVKKNYRYYSGYRGASVL